MTYAEKLKDPRWQKLRLKILERDEWTCANCQAVDVSLHVHHHQYLKGKAPWDYPEENFETLCEVCHEEKEDMLQELRKIGSGLPCEELDMLRMIAWYVSKDYWVRGGNLVCVLEKLCRDREGACSA